VFAYDGDNLIEETNSSGGAVARYTQTQNIDEPLSMLRSSATSYYQADGLDSIISLTNSSGASAQTYAYDSFGKVTASSGSLVNSFQYTGRELDSETGLYYYRARYYDPGAGRFLSEDPITFTGGIDFYSYVENNPTEFTDALGLQARPMPIPSPAPPAPGPGPVLVPDPAPEPEIAFCMRFPWICAAAAVLLSPKPTDSGGDFGPGNYHNPTLNRHSNSAIQKCANNGCPPCAPPVGTISYRLDSTGPPHNGVPTPHWHLYVMQQNPNNCQCQWVDIPDNQGGFGGGSPPPGTGPIAPAGGGGHP
jgi:RHS repeat-associated protein